MVHAGTDRWHQASGRVSRLIVGSRPAVYKKAVIYVTDLYYYIKCSQQLSHKRNCKINLVESNNFIGYTHYTHL